VELKKSPLKKQSQRGERIAIVLVIIIPFPVLALVKYVQPELHLTNEYIWPFAYLASIIFPLATLWVGLCSYIAEYAKEMNTEIAEVRFFTLPVISSAMCVYYLNKSHIT